MASEWSFDLKQKFNIKCIIDICTFVITCLIFILFAKIKAISPYDTILFLVMITALNAAVYFITKQWISRHISLSLTEQSATISATSQEIFDEMASQRKTLETLSGNTKNVSVLIEKLKNISENFQSTSKNTEKQINQSITFSQKENESIISNADKMIVLRQKIQMIAELVLELSEHTQQIGNSISVVDDIAEQTNMLALNAAVEAARAGEHGKGFAVVAGEIRKLADESKQAITKITSLTSSIQYTTNSTVMATEEGSKEIESVVKEINLLASDSDTLLNLIKEILESIDALSQNAKKQDEIIDKLNSIDEESAAISSDLIKSVTLNSEKISKLNSLSKNIKNSASEG
ncbi:hypothetical protein IKQ21_07710 [bacterium]|nr:hypothetical protein [bacterium]